MLVGIKSREIVSNCPYIDELIVFDNSSKELGIKKIIALAASTRREYFNIVIDLQNNRTSHLLGLLSMSPMRIGYKTKKLDFLLMS